MNRLHPFFSPLAWLGTLFLLGLLGAKLHSEGGLVFNPGELSARQHAGIRLQGFSAHAEFEADCAQCHQPWRGISSARCGRCHTEVIQQLKDRRGLHGALDRADDCARCHPDHRGRYGTMTGRLREGFDHARTGFRLDGAHRGVACERCHPGSEYRTTPTACAGCHAAQGGASAAAGTGSSIAAAAAQGGASAAAGTGGSLAASAAPASHDERFAGDCAACHSTRAWTPARWDDHRFPLDHGGGGIECATCHPATYAEYTCYGCHEHRRDRMVRRHREEQLTDAELADCLACHYSRRARNGGDHGREREEHHREGDGDEGEGREHERGGEE